MCEQDAREDDNVSSLQQNTTKTVISKEDGISKDMEISPQQLQSSRDDHLSEPFDFDVYKDYEDFRQRVCANPPLQSHEFQGDDLGKF
jgi:hypothetical protein